MLCKYFDNNVVYNLNAIQYMNQVLTKQTPICPRVAHIFL